MKYIALFTVFTLDQLRRLFKKCCDNKFKKVFKLLIYYFENI